MLWCKGLHILWQSCFCHWTFWAIMFNKLPFLPKFEIHVSNKSNRCTSSSKSHKSRSCHVMQHFDHYMKKILLPNNFLCQNFVAKQLHTDMYHSVWQLVHTVTRITVQNQCFGNLLIIFTEYSGKCFLYAKPMISAISRVFSSWQKVKVMGVGSNSRWNFNH